MSEATGFRLGRMMLRIGAAAAALGLLVGCVRIPTDSSVSTIPIEALGEGDDLLVVPEGPVAGASAREILIGFIRAGRGPQNGYAVAAEFLTESFATTWWAGAGVLVTSSGINPVEREDGGLSLTVDVAGELDADGSYTTAPAATQRELVYELVQEDGEWRISAGPDGTVLSPMSFSAIFGPVELHYFTPDYRFLVPELRWFVVGRATINRIVDELLDADSPLLASGVFVSAFPAGTDRPEAITVDGNQASVTLSSHVLAASELDQSRMLEQLRRSMGSLGQITRVTVVAGGFPMAIPELAGVDATLVDPTPLGIVDGAFGVLGADRVAPLGELSPIIDQLDPVAVTVGRSRDTAAVLTELGAVRVSGGGSELVDDRAELTAPSIDPWGWMWTTPVQGLAGLRATSAGGTVLEVPLALAADEDPTGSAEVVAWRISRDGSRLVAALESPEGIRVVVWGIQRDEALAPLGLVAPRLLVDGIPVGDLAWVGAEAVAVLGVGANPAVVLLPIGGRGVLLGSAPGAVQLVAGGTVESIRVRDEDGDVLRFAQELGWVESNWTASLLGVQQ